MNEKTKDYDLEFTEDEVLSRWDKIMQWFGMAKTFLTLGKLVWAFIFATGAAVVIGEVTDTTPLRDLATELGFINVEPEPDVDDVVFVTLMEHEAEISRLQEMINSHNHPIPAHEHDLSHTHSAAPLIQHEHDFTHKHKDIPHSHAGPVFQEIFDDHVDLLH